MQDPKVILALLGIPWEKVSFYNVTTDGKQTIISLELYDLRPRCPYCGGEVKIKGYYKKQIRVGLLKDQQVWIYLRQRRYVCTECHRTFSQSFNLAGSKANISNATKFSIIEALKSSRTMTDIARDYSISPTTVMRLFDIGVPKQLRKPLTSAICIDEFHFVPKKQLGKFPAVISDWFTGEILDIVRSRRKDILKDYFNQIPWPELNKVAYFISDMNETYRSIKKLYFKNASHIIDMFHVCKLFTEAIQSIRKKIMKSNEYNSPEYIYLKKEWKLFNMHVSDLMKIKKINKNNGCTYTAWDKVSAVLKKYPDLNKVYLAKEEFYDNTTDPLYWKEAESLINFQTKQFINSGIEELESIGKTFNHWHYELVTTITKNYKGIRFSNAVAEANNNTIQTFIDQCYGLTDFDRMRKRILYIIRNKNRKKKGEE